MKMRKTKKKIREPANGRDLLLSDVAPRDAFSKLNDFRAQFPITKRTICSDAIFWLRFRPHINCFLVVLIAKPLLKNQISEHAT